MFSAKDLIALRSKMTRERAFLVAAVQLLPPERAGRGLPELGGEEGWSPLQQLAHLWEMELAYDSWIVACLEQDVPDLSVLPMPRPPISIEEANRSTTAALLAGLAAERAKTEFVIDRWLQASSDLASLATRFSCTMQAKLIRAMTTL